MTSSFFEPSMNVLLFLMVKKFVYLEVLLILAGVAAHFVVPYFQIYQQPWAGIAQFLIRTWNGMFTPLLVSFVFLNTMPQKHRRVMVIDGMHILLIIGLVGLWVSTL